MTNLRSIIYSKTPLFKSFNNKNIIETECLLGESFLVTKTQNEYSFGKLLTDNYTGWVETNALGDKSETTHRVITLSTNIYLEKTPKSVVLKGLSLGCELHVRRCEQEWAQVLISNNSQIIKAYVPKNHLSKIEDVDIALESAKLTKSQIINQVATAILAQANASSNIFLKLLQ